MTGGFTVRTPGKLILSGEYAVIHGAPSIVAAVARHATCRVEEQPGPLRLVALGEGPLEVRFVDGKPTLHPAPQQPARFTLVQRVLETMAADGLPEGVTLTLDSSALSEAALDGTESTVKLGLGSSAAAAVALTAALHVARTGERPNEALRRRWFEQAQRAHLAAQNGIGSGVDVAASALGSVICYVRRTADPADAVVTPVRYDKLGVRMIAAWTGHAASTVDLVGKVEKWHASGDPRAQARMTALQDTAREAADAADQGDRRGFLMALGRYGDQMQLLGEESGADIVSAAHRRIRELARQHECVAKPSGAGGGDVAVCFCPSGWEADALREALRKEGFPPVQLDFDHEGTTVE